MESFNLGKDYSTSPLNVISNPKFHYLQNLEEAVGRYHKIDKETSRNNIRIILKTKEGLIGLQLQMQYIRLIDIATIENIPEGSLIGILRLDGHHIQYYFRKIKEANNVF